MENLELYEAFKQVPDNAKKAITGGRLNGKTDINPMWRIKTLTGRFGPIGIGWYYIPTKKWLEPVKDEVAAFVDIDLFIKVDGEWSKPIHGTGGSKLAEKEKNGIYVSDECYKMATTDAISVACKQLGIGADVYWNADQTKYDRQSPPPNPGDAPVTKEEINDLFNECGRTGLKWQAVCRQYQAAAFSAMTYFQYVDAMARFKATPDKPSAKQEPDLKTVPPEDGGLPFN